MSDDNRIQGRPRIPQGRQQAPAIQVQAQQLQHMAAMPAPDADLTGLLRGLSELNPALQKYEETQWNISQQEQDLKNREGAEKGPAFAQGVESPREALTGAPIPGLENVPEAVNPAFHRGMMDALAQRQAIQNKTDALTAYAEQKDAPDFNLDAFIRDRRASSMAGLKDPRVQTIIGQHASEWEAQVRQDHAHVLQTRREEVRTSTLMALTGDAFTANMDANAMGVASDNIQARGKELGFTSKEVAQYTFMQLSHLSQKAGGAPEVFDVFDRKDAEGFTLLERNPQLAASVDAARHQATQLRDKAIMQGAEEANAKVLARYESDIDAAPESVTMDRLLGDLSKYGAFQSPGQVASYWGRAQDAMRRKQATGLAMADADAQRLWIHDPKMQGQVLDQKAAPLVRALAEATSAGKPEAVAEVGSKIMQLHSRTGATVPVDQLQRYTKTLVTNLQNPEGASPQFQAAAALFRSMSGNTQYRDMYFDEKTTPILDTYNHAIAGGSDAKSAYQAAYQNSTPQAADFKASPEFQKLIDRDVKKYVEGSSWLPTWLGGRGRPGDNGAVPAWIPFMFGGKGLPGDNRALSMDAVSEIKKFRGQFPFATEGQLEMHLRSWSEKNWVLDTTTNSAVKVPPGLGGPAAREALSAYSKAKAEQLNLGGRSDAKWSVQYLPQGSEGIYSVVAFNGSSTQSVGTVNLQDLLATERAKKVLSPEELAQLAGVRQALQRGEQPLVPEALLAKAELTKAFTETEGTALRDASQRQFVERLRSHPVFSFGAPSFSNLQFIPGKEGKVDNQLTARVASEFLGNGAILGGGAGSTKFLQSRTTTGLAAALTTMGEGVMLTAYDDPAKGAGKNIGMGYNLEANKATVDADLKAAGVDPSLVQAVKEGRASLTPDQAKRLLLVALPRYESQVREVANGTSSGLWDRMTVSQRAAMIDVAYQVGSTDKFKKAWAALAKGDEATFREEAKVTYVDRQGTRKEDTRRNNLRAAMLAGQSVWDQTVQKFGSLPSTKLQAISILNK